jgi:putative Mg2+ transporter-C (MgtC) family protein
MARPLRKLRRLTPSRRLPTPAAQIVSGIGFIGGGPIFVRRDAVRGLTTAAVVWLTAAVGMATGAGLPVLALMVTAGHFLIVLCFAPLAARLPAARGGGRAAPRPARGTSGRRGLVTVRLLVQGRQPVAQLAASLFDLDGLHAVASMRETID